MGKVIPMPQTALQGMMRQPLTEKSLSGQLWYSTKQFRALRKRGSDRTFGKLFEGGHIVEYTELVSFDLLEEEPDAACPIDDAQFLGWGSFHHFMDDYGREW